jgi:hypothetical protein
MNLTVTIAPDSFASIKAAVVSELQQPTLIGTNPPVRAVAEEIMERHGDALVNSIVDTRMDDLAQRIAEQTDKSEVAAHIDMGDLASEISCRRLSEYFDMTDLAEAMSDNVDTDDLADRIANNLSIDTDTVVEKVAENINDSDIAREVAEELNLEDVALAINEAGLAREIVRQFINNEEFRKSFMETLLLTISQSITK